MIPELLFLSTPKASGLTNPRLTTTQYWRRRPSYPERATVIRVDAATTSSPFALVPEGSVSLDAVSIIDGGSAEHWVVVPEAVKARKAEIKTALEAAQKLSEAWKQRGFASRTPYHVSFSRSYVAPSRAKRSAHACLDSRISLSRSRRSFHETWRSSRALSTSKPSTVQNSRQRCTSSRPPRLDPNFFRSTRSRFVNLYRFSETVFKVETSQGAE